MCLDDHIPRRRTSLEVIIGMFVMFMKWVQASQKPNCIDGEHFDRAVGI